MKRTTMTALAALMVTAAVAGIAAADGPMRGGPMGPMGMGPGGGIDFAAIDTDGNGSLSRAELQARAAARLAEIDENSDGVLDRDELIAAVPGPHGGFVAVFAPDPAERFVDRILAMMGATESGQVDVTVMADHRVNMLLAVADENRDAAISQAEADAMQAHHRHGRGDRGDRGPGRPGPDAPPAPPMGPQGDDGPAPRG